MKEKSAQQLIDEVTEEERQKGIRNRSKGLSKVEWEAIRVQVDKNIEEETKQLMKDREDKLNE